MTSAKICKGFPMSEKFDHKKIEAKWQKKWEEEKLYTPDIDDAKNPFYNLWMFPYPWEQSFHRQDPTYMVGLRE